MRFMNEAVDEVRKREHREHRARGDEALARSRYVWLYAQEQLPPKHREQYKAHVGGPQELIDMAVAIGHWNTFSQLLQSLAVPLEEGTPSWPPDGKRPAPV
jgi:hypothetical protein